MNSPTRFDTKKIGDIVAENYNTAAVFREFGLDFCCGGNHQLRDVCKDHGVPFSEIVARLEELSTTSDSGDNYSSWSPSFLIDYIVNTHHNFVRQKASEIEAYAAKVARVHGDNHPENIDIYQTFRQLANELLEHLEEEEASVFPLIKKAAAKREAGELLTDAELNALKTELEQMETEHEQAGRLMGDIRHLSRQFTPPADACATYRILYQNLEGFERDLHKHVHLENNILFQKAEKLLAA